LRFDGLLIGDARKLFLYGCGGGGGCRGRRATAAESEETRRWGAPMTIDRIIYCSIGCRQNGRLPISADFLFQQSLK